ncbi:MAG: hypothetical protein QW471_01370 [Candidatus Woesearchaeota archaeon]
MNKFREHRNGLFGGAGGMVSQSEIEDILINAKYCQGLLKEAVPDFKYVSYAKNSYTRGECKDESIERIRSFKEDENCKKLDERTAYSELCRRIAVSKAEGKINWTSEVSLDEIIYSLEEMRDIAHFYAENKEYRISAAETAEKEIVKLIKKCRKHRRILARSKYCGPLSVEALAADIFEGRIIYEERSEDEYRSWLRKICLIPKNEDDMRKLMERTSDMWNYACHKKSFGNIFEKIFYSILYPRI